MKPGAEISKERIAAVVTAVSKERGESYTIVWGAPHAEPAGEFAKRAKAFSLPTLGGDRFDLARILGHQPVVLVFWASWCAPCLEEAPHLVQLYKRYGDSVGFVSVSIDALEDHDKLRRVVGELQLPYPVALDPNGDVLAKYASAAGIPLTFVFDREGEAVYQHDNYEPGDESALKDAIRRALGEAPGGKTP